MVGVGSETVSEGRVPLERRALEELASAGGGHYVSLTIDDKDMKQVDRQVDSHYIVIDDSALPWLDSGYPLLFPAMALWLMWFRRGWTLTWAWLAVPLLLLQAPAPAVAEDAGEDIAQQATSHC